MWRTREFENFLKWAAHYNAHQRAEGQPTQQMQLFGMDLYSLTPSLEKLLLLSKNKSDHRLSDLSDARRPETPARSRFGRTRTRTPTRTRARVRGHRGAAPSETASDKDFSALACVRDAADRTDNDDDHRNPAISGACAARVTHALAPYLKDGPHAQGSPRTTDGAPASRAARKEDEDEFFNALTVSDMADYVRPDLDRSEAWHWNRREEHMADVLDILAKDVCAPETRFVVWAHNSHCWDASATSQGDTDPEPTLSLGQIMRREHPGRTLHIGFLTYQGSVTGADEWGDPVQSKPVRPAPANSYEGLLHQVTQRMGAPALVLDLQQPSVREALARWAPWREERAIGAVYHPKEPDEHTLNADLWRQFDMVVFIERTAASHVFP
jgi:erythromycin esterase-like protein